MPREHLLATSQWIDEQTTWYYTRTLTDELGIAMASTAVGSLELTWYELDSGTDAIVNNLDAVNVKNDGTLGTLSSGGKFELRLRPEDTMILTPTRRYEHRRALLVWTNLAGTKTFRHEVDVILRNLQRL